MSFLIILGIYALSFWQPTILKSMGLSVLQIGFYSVIPAVAGIAANIVVGRHSDRSRERRWHFALSAVVGASGLALTTLFMHQGRVHEMGPPAELFGNPRTAELKQFLSSLHD